MITKNFSIRIDNELLDKLHIIAAYEGRSCNSQIIYLIRKVVEEFESVNGEINPKKSDKSVLDGKLC